MPTLMLRDLPASLFEEIRRYGRVRGLGTPAAAEALLRKALDAAAAEDREAAKAGPRVVVIPKQCRKCRRQFEIHRRHTPGFGALEFHQVPCPHCGEIHHLELPGEAVAVVPANEEKGAPE